MLKLVDGTELTEEVKEAFKKSITSAYIKMNDGTILSSANYLKTIKLEDFRYNEETGNIIGEAISKRVTLGLFNQENALNIENKEFELIIGTQLSLNEENNFYDIDDVLLMSKDMTINDDDTVTATFDNTDGTKAQYLNLFTNVSGFLGTSEKYFAVLEIINVTGTGAITITDSAVELEPFSNLENGLLLKYKINTLDNFLNSNTTLKSYVKFNPGESGSITFRISIFQNDINMNNFEYKKFNSNNKYISFGNFIVQRPENNDTKESTDFEAFDYMCKTNVEYKCNVTFPCTYKDIAEDVCNQCGLELGSKTFRNYNKSVPDNFFINKEQCRFVLKEIAKIAFSWVRIGQDNKVYFDFNIQNDVAETFTLDDYIELNTQNDTVPINTVVLKYGDIEGENAVVKSDALIEQYGVQKELVVDERYFAYDQATRENLVEAGKELFGLYYNPVDFKSIGTIYLESNDLIRISDRQGNYRYSYCFNHTIDYNGAVFDSISMPAMTETETKYQHEKDEDLRNRKTEIIVNKANQVITSIVEAIDEEGYGDFSKFVQTVSGVEQIVSKTVDISETVAGFNPIELKDCIEGELQYLNIRGNNTIFDSLKPSNTLYPSDTLYPRGDSYIYITIDNIIPKESTDYIQGSIGWSGEIIDSDTSIVGNNLIDISRFNKMDVNLNDKYYLNYRIYDKDEKVIRFGDLYRGATVNFNENYYYIRFAFRKTNGETITPYDIEEINPNSTFRKKVDLNIGVLRQYSNDVYDEYIYNADANVESKELKSKVIRRVGITENGTLYALATPYEENVPIDNIVLERGNNVIDFSEGYLSYINANYVKQNNFTKLFATTYEVQSAIRQLANAITLIVSQTVGNDEIIAKLNLAVENDEGIITIEGNKIVINTDYFSISKEGKVSIKGKLDDFYIYTDSDVYLALASIKGLMTLPDFLKNLYDCDEDGSVTVIDVTKMQRIRDGKDLPVKKLNGSVTISADDLNNNISFTAGENLVSKIGMYQAESYIFQGRHAFIGTNTVADTVGSSFYTGIALNGDKPEIRLMRSASSTGTVITDSMVDAYHVYASNGAGGKKGKCMHSPDNTISPSADHDYLVHYNGNAMIFYVDPPSNQNWSVGSFWINSGSSDKRLKHNIEKVNDNLLKVIRKLEIKQFVFNNDENNNKVIGVIAQDLIELGEKYGLDLINDYNIVKFGITQPGDEKQYYAVDYERIQLLKIKCLENRVESLEERLQRLEDKINE